MINHTPGPWRMVKTHVPDRFFVDTESVPHIAITGWGNVRQLEGDARLIAAAPRLLEALEHSTTALSYIAAELEELGEHEDAAMMERQAEENRAAIEAARES